MHFLDALEETDEKLVEFAVGGLCNAALGKIPRTSTPQPLYNTIIGIHSRNCVS